jgi:RHS repeat-associated protein
VWDSVTVSATGQTSVTGHVFVPKNPESYTYDADGNLLSDGRWTNSWDAENRLVSMTSLSGAPSASLLQLAFTYDYMGRRIQKIVSTNNGTNYVGEYTNKYAYDGWNCLAILNPSLSLSNSFLWGSDLSGSVQGAGGVGGLIKVSYYGTTTTNCFVAFDGNGNVSALVNASNGVTVANYDYAPFGELIRASGPMAKLNPFRFSTKYNDDETDFVYYGYRYYNPSTGRWLSRDPMQEKGCKNLYAFWENDLINNLDATGLQGTIVNPGSQQAGGGIPAWPQPPPSFATPTYSGCGAFSISDRQAIQNAINTAGLRLQEMIIGTMPLPSGGTTSMATCLLGQLNSGFNITCVGPCNPLCWVADGMAYKLMGSDMLLCAGKIMNQPGGIQTVELIIFHELCHVCGKWSHGPPNDPDTWGSTLTVVLPGGTK